MKKKMLVAAMVAMAVACALAAPKKAVESSAARVTIDQFPRLGRGATLSAPSLAGGTIVGTTFTKPRKWIVLEAKYSTYKPWQDRLVFEWHVLLETKSATEKNKTDKIPPYSYLTTTVSYANVPRGTHTASVCLHPSYLERYGEAKAVGLIIKNAEGEVLAGDTESEIKAIRPHTKFWEDQKLMGQKDANGEPYVEQRQGLLDRSKTIWALVNPNDYEMVVQ